MKRKFNVVSLAALVLVFISASLITSTIMESLFGKDNYESGIVSGQSYENKALNLKITLPQEYRMASKQEIESVFGTPKSQNHLDEMYAQNTETGVPSIRISSDTLGIFQDESDCIKEIQNGFPAEYDVTVSEEMEEVIAGQTFSKVEIYITIQGTNIIVDSYFKKVDNHLVTIMVWYNVKAFRQKEKLLSAFQSIE